MLVGWPFDWQASSEARHGSTHDASEPRGMRLEAMEHDTDPRAQQRESAFTGHNGAEDIQERKRNKTKRPSNQSIKKDSKQREGTTPLQKRKLASPVAILPPAMSTAAAAGRR